MKPGEDVRAQVLAHQLDEIDRRIQWWKRESLPMKHRLILSGTMGGMVVFLASKVSELEGVQNAITISLVGLIIAFPLYMQVIQIVQTRRLEREKDRILALYEEIDRRVALRSGSPGLGGEVG